jgi:hypothetical protein
LGDGDGLAELEAALHDVLRQESGTLALGTRQWLAGALHHWRGPAAELAARRELEAMAAERGLGFIVSMGVAEDVRVLCELGRYDEALALSDQALDAAEAQPRWMVVQRALALLDLGRLDDTTLRQVAATPPADPDDLRHILGTALVIAGAALGRGDVATARSTLLCLPAAQHFVDRDGAVELIPRLLRTAARAGCAELVRGVHGVDDIGTPLRQAIASTVAGLRLLGEDAPVAAAPVLQEAFDRWQRLGFVAEASAVQADLQQCRRPVDR